MTRNPVESFIKISLSSLLHAGHNKYLNTDYTICILAPQTASLVFKYLEQLRIGLKAIKVIVLQLFQHQNNKITNDVCADRTAQQYGNNDQNRDR